MFPSPRDPTTYSKLPAPRTTPWFRLASACQPAVRPYVRPSVHRLDLWLCAVDFVTLTWRPWKRSVDRPRRFSSTEIRSRRDTSARERECFLIAVTRRRCCCRRHRHRRPRRRRRRHCRCLLLAYGFTLGNTILYRGNSLPWVSLVKWYNVCNNRNNGDRIRYSSFRSPIYRYHHYFRCHHRNCDCVCVCVWLCVVILHLFSSPCILCIYEESVCASSHRFNSSFKQRNF